MDAFLHTVASYIERNSLLEAGKPVLVALSGGADSVALLIVLSRLGYKVTAAHCNFHLRGEESMRDERFVRDLCRRHCVELQVKDFDVPAYMQQHGASAEMACRELRYAWFEQLRKRTRSQAIAVAHHRDDNIETFMLNALRGTGIAGLTGMHPRQGNVVRPLLCVSRHDIEQFLKQNRQHYVTDSTNLENEALRNRLRNVILPDIDKQFPQARLTLTSTIANVLDCYRLYQELTGRAKAQVCHDHTTGFDINIERLLAYRHKLTLLFEILKPCGFNHEQCEHVLSLVEGDGGVGRTFLSPAYMLVIGRDTIEVLPAGDNSAQHYPIDLNCNSIAQPIALTVTQLPGKDFSPTMVNGRDTIALDAAVLQCKRVMLRHWHDGDRMAPYGMHGTKLVSDLFTNLKLGEREKRAAWLLEAEGEILWVVGYRATSRFKVTAATTTCLILHAGQ